MLTTQSVKPKLMFLVSELSGSLGDLGTLIPILITLSVTNQINLPSSLIFGGIFNILLGVFFKIPVCVQPMKAIAATALLQKLDLTVITSAGLFVAVVTIGLGLSNQLKRVMRWTPMPVLRGIQLGSGIQLMVKAADLINSKSAWSGSSFSWFENYYITIVLAILVLIMYNDRKVPLALIIFVLALILSIVLLSSSNGSFPKFDPFKFQIYLFDGETFAKGILTAGLGQLPLTLLNSVIALQLLIEDLFPEKSISVNQVAISVGLMNLISCWFGCIPYCSGSGGLAGQYKFGARTGISVIILGAFKLLVGALLGNSILPLMKTLPSNLLGLMLFICGLELAKVATKFRDTNFGLDKDWDFYSLVLTSSTVVAFKSDAVGYVTGMVATYIFRWRLNSYPIQVLVPESTGNAIDDDITDTNDSKLKSDSLVFNEGLNPSSSRV